MLAHGQGALLNAARLASGLDVSAPTVSHYIDLFVDLLVRCLQPFHVNTKKRLVKSPKVYIRDSGLVHALLGLETFEALAGHPVIGASWEGFVMENLLATAPPQTRANFYRTAAGAEWIWYLSCRDRAGMWAVEIKHSLAPKLSRGFHHARADLQPARSFVAYAGEEQFPIAEDVEVIGSEHWPRFCILCSHDHGDNFQVPTGAIGPQALKACHSELNLWQFRSKAQGRHQAVPQMLHARRP